MQRRGPVVLFSNWQPTDHLAASVARLLLSMPHRLSAPPLNWTLGLFPLSGAAHGALREPILPPRTVLASRSRARIRRSTAGNAQPGDLIRSDWEYALAKLDDQHGGTLVGLESVVPIDSVQADGSVRLGPRPLVGHRVRRGEPRLPRIVGLHGRHATAEAIRELTDADLLVVDLHRARGVRTSVACGEILGELDTGLPTIVLAENALELHQLSRNPCVKSVSLSIEMTQCPSAPVVTWVVGRERAQLEQELRFALPPPPYVGAEENLVHLAAAAWRAIWRNTDVDQVPALLSWFRKDLDECRHHSLSSASRFNAVASLLERVTRGSSEAVRERAEASMLALESVVESGAGRVTAVVGSVQEREWWVRRLSEVEWGPWVRVLPARHAADAATGSAGCVVLGHGGRHTVDAAARCRGGQMAWVVDPIEAIQLGFDARRYGQDLDRLGLTESGSLLGRLGESLVHASGGLAEPAGAGEVVLGADESGIQGVWGPVVGGRAEALPDESHTEVLDGHHPTSIYLADGTILRVDPQRRFDVVRAGAIRPQVALASQVVAGDQLLVVRGEYQRTLSDLLIEEMDLGETRAEAEAREAWATLCRVYANRLVLSPVQIAAEVRRRGGHATTERVRAWLTPRDGGSMPQNWRTFTALAEVLGINLPEAALRQMWMAIKRWRVAHRLRGREVVKLCRAAWFGGLAPADLSRIEERWGLTARDLVEGSRIVEVEVVETVEEDQQ